MQPLPLVALLTTVAAGALPAQTPREQVERKLGGDPLAVLRTIGETKTRDDAKEAIARLCDRLDGQEQLWLFRQGLASTDERTVFGAVLSMPDQFAVPELRNAARIVLPRLGDADCPVDVDDACPLLGSVDMAATADAMRKLPVHAAVWLAGAMHRMVRGEHVPALCEIALAAKGAVRNAVFSNACLAAEYSDENVPLLVKTWLQMRGAKPDADGDGLPGVLAAALRTHLDAPRPRELAEGETDDREPELPQRPCMRWLAKCKPSPKDLPLLQRLVAGDSGELCHAALCALGAMDDAESLAFLRGFTAEEYQRVSLQRALARRGDTRALDELLAGGEDELAAGLAAASPDRRRTFAASLLALPLEDALAHLSRLQESTRADPMWYAIPAYDDAWLADLEPLAAAAKDLHPRLLRALVGTVPSCATTRLADALLAHPAAELFAPDKEGEDEDDPEWRDWRGDLGYSGAWPFLEVTRPEAFRQRLREGLRAEQAVCRDHCAELLVALGDTENLDRLVAWIASADYPTQHWLRLARSADAKVVELLKARVAAPAEGDDVLVLLRAIAAAQGMPHEFASDWTIDERDHDAVRTALLGGDVAAAFLCSAAGTTGVDHSWPRLAAWREPRVQALLRERRRHPELDAQSLASYDLEWALHAKDGAALKAAQQLIDDGRYAMHYGVPELVLSRGRDLATLPYWIAELGGNCCRACVAEEVIKQFFREDARAYDWARMAEPAVVRLRRRLLPLQSRLRWSRIADAYVVAGA